jgi:hypothetical protein
LKLKLKIKAMRQLLKTTILSVLLITVGATLSAQDIYKLKSFDGISVMGNIEVILEKGEQARAEVTASGFSEEDVSVFVREGVLKLQMLKTIFKEDEEVTIKVVYTEPLDYIKVGAGSRLVTSEPIEGDKFELKAVSGGQLELEVYARKIKVYAAEGGQIELKGTVEEQYATAVTGGEYFGLDLDCQYTEARANTGGELSVVAKRSLDARANTGGFIEYAGQPEERSTNSLFTGKIRRIKNGGDN